MLKTFDVWKRAMEEGGETVLGLAELGTHACYLIFGFLEPGQTGRVLRPGEGHEEIVCLVAGEAILNGPGGQKRLRPGEAFYLVGNDTFTLANEGQETAVYLAAGGHSPGAHHH
jgi:uncharacterized cupin superfamily protein